MKCCVPGCTHSALFVAVLDLSSSTSSLSVSLTDVVVCLEHEPWLTAPCLVDDVGFDLIRLMAASRGMSIPDRLDGVRSESVYGFVEACA